MQPHPALPVPFPAPVSAIPALEAPGVLAILVQGGDARPGGDPAETQKAPSSPFGGFGWLPMVAIFAILWFVMIGPERKNKKQREALLANLKKGDEVMTLERPLRQGGEHPGRRGRAADRRRGAGQVQPRRRSRAW